MDLEVNRAELGEQLKCYGHCDQPATPRFPDQEEMAIVTVVCHAGYASKMIAYGDVFVADRFRSFLLKAPGVGATLADEDIRTATRFSWDVTGTAGHKVMKVAYWTQNYGRSKNDDPNRAALFVCQNCNSLYLQPVSNRSILCVGCHSVQSEEAG